MFLFTLNIAPLQRRWAHSQVWHIGVHLLTRGERYLFPPDQSNRVSPYMAHVTLQRVLSPSTPQGVKRIR